MDFNSCVDFYFFIGVYKCDAFLVVNYVSFHPFELGWLYDLDCNTTVVFLFSDYCFVEISSILMVPTNFLIVCNV